ncbi:hypothetical protein [Maribellus mangrovi]|uniref:hypothetical protein n=1 Tax=Maribellus mangrovi TaxID=3133146 RepID=UPI0030EBBC5C
MIILEFNFDDNIEFNHNGKLYKLRRRNFNKVLNLISKSILYKGVDYNGYTTIHNSVFNSGYTGYQAYLDYLVKYEYIKRDYYEVGVRPYGYRFTEFFKSQIEVNRIIYRTKPRTTQKRIQKFNEDVCIKEHINDRLIEDFMDASKSVVYYPRKKQIEKTKDEWGRYFDIKKWLSNNIKLHKWKKEYLIYKWSKNRLYTNFTFLSSHIRANNILLNNEKIVEFDIRSSFPLMLALYCLDVSPDLIYDYDFESYCSSILTGQFYSKLTQGLNNIRNITKGNHESDISNRFLSKNEAKILFQMYVNGNSKKTHYLNGLRTDINRYMEIYYPQIHLLLLNLKESGEKPFTVLAKIESQIIFDIVEELYLEYDDIRILTCHDAIYVPASFESETDIIWNKHMDRLKSRLPSEISDANNSPADINGVECGDEYLEIEEWDYEG